MANTTTANHLTPENTGFPLKLKKRYDNFIGGAWVAPVQGEYYTNLTPITGQTLCEVASSSSQDIELALDAAHDAKGAWGKMSVAGARQPA
ncbi:Aldehyde dehydrogenase B [Serratia fonticola]|uniref:Aldehyde dehydrogenase B n=1 Tax=Serratia fonticola TaxID=47917 RepID=A0A4U9VF39_SERFO|nr:Aldehyde dehydrogenase B [Serratia fonticola]